MKGKKLDRVRDALLKKCEEPGTNATCWPWLTGVNKVSKRQANKFMLGAIIDYQVPADQAWESARCFAEGALDDPDDLWREIVERWTETQWNSHRTWKECALHRRFPASHRRVREIGLDILRQYDSDARLIWRGTTSTRGILSLGSVGEKRCWPTTVAHDRRCPHRFRPNRRIRTVQGGHPRPTGARPSIRRRQGL